MTIALYIYMAWINNDVFKMAGSQSRVCSSVFAAAVCKDLWTQYLNNHYLSESLVILYVGTSCLAARWKGFGRSSAI